MKNVPVDPQVQALLEQLASSGQRPVNELPIDEARAVAGMLAPFDGEPEPVAAVEDRRIPGAAGEIAVRVDRATPEASGLPVVAWVHAGGGVIGDLATADRSGRKLANRHGAATVAVAYRPTPAGSRGARRRRSSARSSILPATRRSRTGRSFDEPACRSTSFAATG